MKNIYTIGHSSHDVEYFLKLLTKYEINCIVDVRNVPFSKYVPLYNKDTIKNILNENNIYCVYMGKELGIIRGDKEFLTVGGYVDFEKIKKTTFFKLGIKRIRSGFQKGYNIAIMCTEKDPIDCHRSILIGRELNRLDYSITHILPDGNVESTGQFEQRLLDMYFPKGEQQSLFHTFQEDHRSELLNKAYKLRNKDIGYRPKDQ